MIKAGFIGLIFGFIYMMGLTLFLPLCTLCLTPFLGFGIGYLANWFDTPAKLEQSMMRGLVAGGMTGLGVLVGQIMATLVNGVLVTNSKQIPLLIEEFGWSDLIISNSNEYWQATLTVNSFCGLFNLALIIGLALLGSTLWFQRRKDKLMKAEIKSVPRELAE